jgi:hypothetical protein
MTPPYLYSSARSRRYPTWRRWLLVLIGLAALFLAPALAHSGERRAHAAPANASAAPVTAAVKTGSGLWD